MTCWPRNLNMYILTSKFLECKCIENPCDVKEETVEKYTLVMIYDSSSNLLITGTCLTPPKSKDTEGSVTIKGLQV